MPQPTPIKIGISACLLGQLVRYDGGHKRDPFLAESLARIAAFVPVCPEAECGLGVPRETMRLIGDPASPRLMTSHTSVDLTARMHHWASQKVEKLAQEGLCAFILKARSPSCAISDAPLFGADGVPIATGPGLFAQALMARLPLLPLADEALFHDPARREAFLARLSPPTA